MINLIKKLANKKEEKKHLEALKTKLELEEQQRELEKRRILLINSKIPQKTFIVRLVCKLYPAEIDGKKISYCKYDYFMLTVPVKSLPYKHSCKATQLTGDHVGRDYTITNWANFCSLSHLFLYDADKNFYQGDKYAEINIPNGLITVGDLNRYSKEINNGVLKVAAKYANNQKIDKNDYFDMKNE